MPDGLAVLDVSLWTTKLEVSSEVELGVMDTSTWAAVDVHGAGPLLSS